MKKKLVIAFLLALTCMACDKANSAPSTTADPATVAVATTEGGDQPTDPKTQTFAAPIKEEPTPQPEPGKATLVPGQPTEVLDSFCFDNTHPNLPSIQGVEEGTGIVKVSGLWLRPAPGTDNEPIGCLPQDSQFLFVESDGSPWTKVRTRDHVGYIWHEHTRKIIRKQ